MYLTNIDTMRNTLKALKKIVLIFSNFICHKFINLKPVAYKFKHLITTYVPTFGIFKNKITRFILVIYMVFIVLNFLFPLYMLYLVE